MTSSKNLSRRKSKIQEIQEPPDGGWGWVILAAGVFGLSFSSSSNRCFSVFYVPLKFHYNTDFASVAWISGFYQAGYGASSLCAHLLIGKFGFRRLFMAAGVLATLSIFTAHWAEQLWLVQLLLGFIPGLCIGQTMTSIFTVNTRYFKKRLNMATQILCVGFTLGALTSCPIFQWLIDNFSWRGALQIIGGYYLNLCVVGSLMRPIVLKHDFDPAVLRQAGKRLTHDDTNINNEDDESLTEKDKEAQNDTARKSVLPYAPTAKPVTNRIWKFCIRLHLYVFLQPLFYAYAFGWVTFSMAYHSTLQYLVPFGTDAAELSSMQSSSLVSAMMVGEIVARIIAAITFDRLTTPQKIVISGIKMLMLSITLLTMSFLRVYQHLLFGCVLLGISGGGTDGIYCVFIADFFGPKLYAAVYGYGNVIIYILVVATTIFTGKFVDTTGRMEVAFLIGSVAAFCSFLISFFMRYSFIKMAKSKQNTSTDVHADC